MNGLFLSSSNHSSTPKNSCSNPSVANLDRDGSNLDSLSVHVNNLSPLGGCSPPNFPAANTQQISCHPGTVNPVFPAPASIPTSAFFLSPQDVRPRAPLSQSPPGSNQIFASNPFDYPQLSPAASLCSTSSHGNASRQIPAQQLLAPQQPRFDIKKLDKLRPSFFPYEGLFYERFNGMKSNSDQDHKSLCIQRTFFNNVKQRAIRLSGVEKTQGDYRYQACEDEILRLCRSLKRTNSDHTDSIRHHVSLALSSGRYHKNMPVVSKRGRKKKSAITPEQPAEYAAPTQLSDWTPITILMTDTIGVRGSGIIKHTVYIDGDFVPNDKQSGNEHCIVALTDKRNTLDTRPFYTYPQTSMTTALDELCHDGNPAGKTPLTWLPWASIKRASLVLVPRRLVKVAAQERAVQAASAKSKLAMQALAADASLQAFDTATEHGPAAAELPSREPDATIHDDLINAVAAGTAIANNVDDEMSELSTEAENLDVVETDEEQLLSDTSESSDETVSAVIELSFKDESIVFSAEQFYLIGYANPKSWYVIKLLSAGDPKDPTVLLGVQFYKLNRLSIDSGYLLSLNEVSADQNYQESVSHIFAKLILPDRLPSSSARRPRYFFSEGQVRYMNALFSEWLLLNRCTSPHGRDS